MAFVAAAIGLHACSDGQWQSDVREDPSPQGIKVVRTAVLEVPPMRFIMVVYDAGRPEWWGYRLKKDEHLLRVRVLLRMRNQDGVQECSYDASCQSYYMEESDITTTLFPLRLRGTVMLSTRSKRHYLSGRLRILPKDENDKSAKFVGRDGSYLSFDLKRIRLSDDAAGMAEVGQWDIVDRSPLLSWQKEIAAAMQRTLEHQTSKRQRDNDPRATIKK